MEAYLVIMLLVSYIISIIKGSAIIFPDSNENNVRKEDFPAASDHQQYITNVNLFTTKHKLAKILEVRETRPGVFSFQYQDNNCTLSTNAHTKSFECNGSACELNKKGLWVCAKEDLTAIACFLKIDERQTICWEQPVSRIIVNAPTIQPCYDGQSIGHDNKCRPHFE